MINKKLIEDKYQEMKNRGLTEDFLDLKVCGGVKVFFNHKPKFTLFSLKIDGVEVFVGSD